MVATVCARQDCPPRRCRSTHSRRVSGEFLVARSVHRRLWWLFVIGALGALTVEVSFRAGAAITTTPARRRRGRRRRARRAALCGHACARYARATWPTRPRHAGAPPPRVRPASRARTDLRPMPPSHETLAEEERRHLAYHVAAQVVVAVRLGFPVRSAALSPGRTPRTRRLIDFGLDVATVASPSEQVERARDLIVATYAGPAGRRLVHHRAGPQHAAADEEAAYALSRTYRVLPPGGIEHFGEPRHLAYLDSLRDRAAPRPPALGRHRPRRARAPRAGPAPGSRPAPRARAGRARRTGDRAACGPGAVASTMPGVPPDGEARCPRLLPC